MSRLTDRGGRAFEPVIYDLVQHLVGFRKLSDNLEALLRPLPEPRNVLDIGGGTGLYRGLWPPEIQFVSVDLDLGKSRAFRARNQRDLAVVSDGVTLPLPTSTMDVVQLVHVAHHLGENALRDVLSEVDRVLRPPGYFLLVDPLWQPQRLRSRLLWAIDRGDHPRTAERLVQCLSEHLRVISSIQISMHHRYLACICRKQRDTK